MSLWLAASLRDARADGVGVGQRPAESPPGAVSTAPNYNLQADCSALPQTARPPGLASLSVPPPAASAFATVQSAPVYAEGDSQDTLMGGNEFAPECEPALRDVGFRVHLNGIRVDAVPPAASGRVAGDYDAPNGIQAAAGWGPSRGFVGPYASGSIDPAFGGFNRHYEYRLPRQGGAVGNVSVGLSPSSSLKPYEKQIIEILPDCRVKITYIWKDIRRDAQGKRVGPSGREYPAASGSDVVWSKVDHPQPVKPTPKPPVKNDLNDPLLPGQVVIPTPPGHSPPPVSSFFDVFFENTLDTEIVSMQLTASSPLGNQTHPVCWQASDPKTRINPAPLLGTVTVLNLPPGGWIQINYATMVIETPSPGTRVTNTVTVTGTTPGGEPMPPTEPGGDALTFNPPVTLTLSKTAILPTTVLPGGRVTYTILYENPGPFTLSKVRITDTLPVSFTPHSGWPLDSFFDVTYRIDFVGALPPGGREHIRIVGVVSPTARPGDWLTNTVRASFDTPLTGAAFLTATHKLLVGSAEHYKIFLPLVLKNL